MQQCANPRFCPALLTIAGMKQRVHAPPGSRSDAGIYDLTDSE